MGIGDPFAWIIPVPIAVEIDEGIDKSRCRCACNERVSQLDARRADDRQRKRDSIFIIPSTLIIAESLNLRLPVRFSIDGLA
jgi:hypothetical protein